ncbi:MAG: endonuclease III [Magnetococcales bacterium]|nr:endonuclease III [Magnetococcales bacterium]
MKKADVVEAFTILKTATPHPKSDLNYRSPFELLVAVVLSAQATDVGVNKATPALFAEADTPEKMAALGEDRIRHHIRSIGLYNNKAKSVYKLSQILVERFDSTVPGDRKSLESLPGVGRKTANVVLNVAFNQPTMAVDTHVFRVSHRLGLAKGKTPTAVEKELVRVIPETFMDHAHHWLIKHGRYVCKARKPECEKCIISQLCPSKLQG